MKHLYIGSLHTIHPLIDGRIGMFMKRLLRTVVSYGFVPPTMDNDKLGMFEQIGGLNRKEFEIKA